MTAFGLGPDSALGGSSGSSGKRFGSILFYQRRARPNRRTLFATGRGTQWTGRPGQAGSHD
jgi:hypothetical protein